MVLNEYEKCVKNCTNKFTCEPMSFNGNEKKVLHIWNYIE